MPHYPPPPAPLPPTPLDQVDAKLARLADEGRPRWVELPTRARARLLRRCMECTLAVADEWAEVARTIKGYPAGSGGHGEEYLAGTLPVMRNLRLFAEALEASGVPRLPKTWRRGDGQWVARVFPQGALDRVLFTGVTVDIWIKPGEEPTQGALYRRKRAGEGGDGGVCAVLGAGNQSSIPPMDVLYKLVVDDEVCLLKMNPVNEQLGPILERALAPLVEGGYLEVVYGGAEVGQRVTDHPRVTSVHITGSARTHDAIIWGTGERGAKNKAEGTPRLDKPISSELGCVSPVLVVPGDWSEKQLRYHARQVASMLTYNCGFNCNGARLIVLASRWRHRARFEELVRERLAATPTRVAYYPTAQATWETFTREYPQHAALGETHDARALPWTLLEGVRAEEGEFALREEPWCGIMSLVELDAEEPGEFLDKAVPFVNERVWGTLSCNVLIHPRTERALGPRFDEAIAALRYGGVAINCWTGLNYGIVNATWGAFPGHPLDDIESGQGVVHNGLLIDHPQKSVVRAPFVVRPTPAWFTDHQNNVELGQRITRFEAAPGLLALPGVVAAALKG
ncbi:MAG: aldehyde dehydrogenase family protein [Myxococcales bacterium]|nr:aldehyde dehydrogenase family protein [Myxococcales bacterium]